MIEQIEAELVGKKLAGADQRHLRQRVELIRWLLTPPDNLATTGELAGLAPPFLPRQCSAWGTGRKSAIDHAPVNDERMPNDLEPERFTLRQAAQARNQPGTTHAKGALRATQAAHREQHVIRWADVF